MEEIDKDTLKEGWKQATCEICGLTARTKQELDEHISHAHRSSAGTSHKKASSEQKIDPFPSS